MMNNNPYKIDYIKNTITASEELSESRKRLRFH